MLLASRDDYARGVRQVLLLTLVLNLLVVAGKLVAGFVAGSLSVISDGVHSATDSLNNVIGLVVIQRASAPPDEDHPHGHRKFETLAAVAVAGVLIVTAFELALAAVKRILGLIPMQVEITRFTFGVKQDGIHW